MIDMDDKHYFLGIWMCPTFYYDPENPFNRDTRDGAKSQKAIGDIMFMVYRPVDEPASWTVKGRIHVYGGLRGGGGGVKKWTEYHVDDPDENSVLQNMQEFMEDMRQDFGDGVGEAVILCCLGKEAADRIVAHGRSGKSLFIHSKVLTPDQALEEGLIDHVEYAENMLRRTTVSQEQGQERGDGGGEEGDGHIT